MINIKKIIILCTLLSNIFIFHTFANNQINISPIVQIISYTDVYGKYPQMMGWGSASVINKNGIILSNDHVVDDGKGALASAFSVCVTKEISQKPVCDYTASLISRDHKLDISLLKIDPKDIYGNPVDYTEFKTIDIDFFYTPKNQDETIAVGYPWVGADTISETKGIVSGVSDYNGYKYIKTDTLIAGGNSGGAFIKDKKLIGIPTFGIGGWGENSMGYALLISEAKEFIEKHIDAKVQEMSVKSILDFNSYRKTIEKINANALLKDDVFEMKIHSDYQVSNYIKNISFQIQQKKQKDTGLHYFSVYKEKTPKIKNDKEKFYYFQSKGLYSKDWQKLLQKNINGLSFYYPVDKTDLSSGGSSWGNVYFTIEKGYLITLYVEAPFYDEKRNKEITQEVENILSSLKINTNNLSLSGNTFSTYIPKIDIKTLPNAIVDTGKYKFYLGNLYEYFEIYLNELIEYNGKGKTAQEIYEVQLKDIDDSMKTMIHFQGGDGFLYCGENTGSYYYNYYNYYGDNNSSMDENGNPIFLETCEINIFFPFNEELNRHNYLSIKLVSQKNTQTKNLSIVIEFLKRFVKLDGEEKEIQIPHILKNQIQLQFKDISNQTTEYKNFLKLLVRYKMIPNTLFFKGDRAVTWGEYLEMYMKNIYKFEFSSDGCTESLYQCQFSKYTIGKTNLHEIFLRLGVKDYNEYIDSQKVGILFDTILNYLLAGVDFGELSYENYFTFQHLINEKQNISKKSQINAFNNSIYGDKKITIYDFYKNFDVYYFSYKTPKYYPFSQKIIYTDDIYKTKMIDFSPLSSYQKELYSLNQKMQCDKSITYTMYGECNKHLQEQIQALQKRYLEDNQIFKMATDEPYFIPLTYGQAISHIFPQVDFGLFDEKLFQKKEIIFQDKNIPFTDEEGEEILQK